MAGLLVCLRQRRRSGADAAAIEALLDEARTGLEEAGLRPAAVEIHEVRAELALREGDANRARSEREEAHRLYQEMGAEGHAARLAAQLS